MINKLVHTWYEKNNIEVEPRLLLDNKESR